MPAAANIRLIAPNALDLATLTDSPAMVAALPVTYLQDPARARVARSVGLPAPQKIRGNWAASQLCNGLALVRHNLTGAATIRLLLYAGLNQTGTLLYDSTAVSLGSIIPYGQYVYGVDTYGAWLFQNWPVAIAMLWFNQVSALSFELQISDPANAAGYIQASRLFLGNYWSPTNGFSYGYKLRWEDESTQERTDGNTLRSDSRDPYRVIRVNFTELPEADRASLTEVFRINGKSKDMFVCLFPSDTGTKGRDYSAAVKFFEVHDLEGDLPLNHRSELALAEA